MRNKKGFTLVELLAVIVILAVIALIATPQVLSMIESSRKGAAESSMLSYIDATEKAIVTNLMNTSAASNYDQKYSVSGLKLTSVSHTYDCRKAKTLPGDTVSFKYDYTAATATTPSVTCDTGAEVNPGKTATAVEVNVDVKGDQPVADAGNEIYVKGNMVTYAQMKFGKYFVTYFYNSANGTTTYCSSDSDFAASQTECAGSNS